MEHHRVMLVLISNSQLPTLAQNLDLATDPSAEASLSQDWERD
jgi:hypothetical protein